MWTWTHGRRRSRQGRTRFGPAGPIGPCVERLEQRRLLSASGTGAVDAHVWSAPSPGQIDSGNVPWLMPYVATAGTAPALVRPSFTASASQVGTTGLKLNWTGPSGATVDSYKVTYIAGSYTGRRQTVIVDAPAAGTTLSGLESFTLYSIDVTAVTIDGAQVTDHLNTWTAEPAGLRRYLYTFDLPYNKTGYTTRPRRIQVFDIENGHSLVRTISLPSGIYNVRGTAAHAATNRLYVAYHTDAANTDTPGGLMCLNLTTGAVMWRKDYPTSVVASPDRFDLTPDGKKIYMPGGENGSTDYWAVIDANNGNVTGYVHHVSSPHNTLVSLDGRYAFLEGQEKGSQPAGYDNTVGVVDTATNTVIRRIGPFKDNVRPFTVNGSASLLFATVENYIGFQVADVNTGKVLYTAAPPGVSQPAPQYHQSNSHGIALTPDEKEVWVADLVNNKIHVWDVSGIKNGIAPKFITSIKTRPPGKNLAGQTVSAASTDPAFMPMWVTASYDGKYMYADGGEVIDVATHKVVDQLVGADGKYEHNRWELEVQFDSGGSPVRATNQFAIGRVR